MRVVIDTNVIVSALLNANGIPAKILSLILNGKVEMLYDNRIIFEYSEVLSRKEFGFNVEIVNDLIDYFRNEGEYIIAEHSKIKFHDETDKKFYEVHKSGNPGRDPAGSRFSSGKSHYLITGNKKHFPKDDTIITPREFIDEIHK